MAQQKKKREAKKKVRLQPLASRVAAGARAVDHSLPSTHCLPPTASHLPPPTYCLQASAAFLRTAGGWGGEDEEAVSVDVEILEP